MSNGSLGGVDLDILEVLNSATSDILNGHSDWSANMQIVDHINSHPENAHKILDIVKKKVTHRKNEVALTSLALLEALVKNCSSVHPFVADRGFMDTLVKTLPKRVRDPSSLSLFKLEAAEDMTHMERIDRTLVILQSWGIAFANSKSYPIFTDIYRSLQKKGVKFPEPDKNETAPVFTPPVKRTASSLSASSSSSSSGSKPSASKSPSAPTPTASSSKSPHTRASGSAAAASSAPSSSTSSASAPPAQAKFKDSECQVAWDSALLLMEMASASTSFHELQSNEIVTELLRTVQRAQKALSSRLGTDAALTNESLMAELLSANDAVVSSLTYLQQLAQGKLKMGTKPPQPTPPHGATNVNANASANDNTNAKPSANAKTSPRKDDKSKGAMVTPDPSAPTATLDFFSGSAPQHPVAASSSSSASRSTTTPPLAPSPSNPSPGLKALLPPPPGSGETKRKKKEVDSAQTPKAAVAAAQPAASAPVVSVPVVDPLDLLFASSSSTSTSYSKPAPAASPAAASSTEPFDLFAAFGASAPPASAARAPAAKPQEDDDPFLALAARK